MRGRDRGETRGSQRADSTDDGVCRVRVKPGGGLIEEQDRRVRDELHPNGHPLLFASGNATLGERRANDGVGAIIEVQEVDYLLDAPVLFLKRCRYRQTEPRREENGFTHSHRRHEQVILHRLQII